MAKRPKNVRMEEVFKNYIQELKVIGKAENTINNYRRFLTSFIEYLPNSEEINYNSVEAFISRYPKSEYKPATRSKYLSMLSVFFNYCIREGILNSNYVKSSWRPKVPKNYEPKSLSVDERARAFVALSSLPIRDRALIELALATGLRRFELSNLKWNDLNFEQRTAKIIGKGNRPNIVVFSQRCAYVLEELYKLDSGSGYVFKNRYGQKLGTKSIYDICIKLGEKIGTDRPLNPHRLRHTHATHLLRNGANYRIIQMLLGHKNIETTKIYARMSNEGLRLKYQRLIG